MIDGKDKIIIRGARVHNLKNINVTLPRNALTVISGVSGSGKSSLAFDTLFAEGQRRYMESLSSYARQFLGGMDKPDVDAIEGLSPAISIEQKSTNKNPRSTVGTITEIYDYYRLLYARIGAVHCPKCGKEIKEQSVDQIIESIMSWYDNNSNSNESNSIIKIQLLSPVIHGKKGEHIKVLDDAKKAGFMRVRIDGVMTTLEDSIKLDKQKKHTIEIVIDRIILNSDCKKRLSSSVETALNVSNGIIIVLKKVGEQKEEEVFFSQKNACPTCGISIPELQPRLFSFNNPYGACMECSGLGKKMEFDLSTIIPDESKSYNEGALLLYTPGNNWNTKRFEALAASYNFSLDTPIKDLTEEQKNALFYGSDRLLTWIYRNDSVGKVSEYSQIWPGIKRDLQNRYVQSWGDNAKERLERFMSHATCPVCNGRRLRVEALGVTVGNKNIYDLTTLSINDAITFFNTLTLTQYQKEVTKQILKEITNRLNFLKNVGLEYLTLDRPADSLSGGEAQRIRLATQIGSSLCGVMYILDEPSIGLHQKDNAKLLDTLFNLRNQGNTVIVVEHDEETLRRADYLIDIGPKAGVHGGQVVSCGKPLDVEKCSESLTGQYLAGKLSIEIPKKRRQGNGNFIKINNARMHNLKNINVSFPLGTFTCITGVSGSGKSTLMSDILYPALSNRLMHSKLIEGECNSIEGITNIDKVINIDQSPIGRTPRSNPATYIGVFDAIRDLFSSLPDSKAMGYNKGRFSFNVRGGRCENCGGSGTITIEMNFLPDVYVTCDVCGGKRFNQDTLNIMYKGKNINDVLNMTIEEAAAFFNSIPHITRKLETLKSVGLGYIQLGQNALTLSGGEAQRVKLANELSKISTGKTLYIMDEPTTGLHFFDVKMLLDVINRLVEQGNTVLMIEHNLDVIKVADYIIDLGPDGGDKGGSIIATGTPEEVAKVSLSYTGQYLNRILNK